MLKRTAKKALGKMRKKHPITSLVIGSQYMREVVARLGGDGKKKDGGMVFPGIDGGDGRAVRSEILC
jgi:hypothetical protein